MADPAAAALLRASEDGDAEAVRALLLADDVDIDTRGGRYERTPLLLAVRNGHFEVMELLLDAQADVNVVDLGGYTALILAVVYDQREIVERLLATDVDLSAVTESGLTALHIAAKKGRAHIVAQLLRAPNADPNVMVKNGLTPLHSACMAMQSESARVLLDCGADLHAKDNDGYEPMHRCLFHHKFAVMDKPQETLMVLVSFGATWDAVCDTMIEAGKARKEAAALRVCVLLWAQEHADGLPFTQIPMDSIMRGPEDTRIFIEELKQSNEVKHRRKICIVGPSKAGKTSLVKSLISRQPSLEHPDDRTIGIDQISLRFGVEEHGKSKIHEVTFWDFAGQDEYQVAHSLFFSARTLYLVCVDLEAFLVAYMQADLMAHTDSQRDQLLNEFVERHILRWVRTIFSQQPDAEFVFVATKDDMLYEFPKFTDIVKGTLRSKLALVEGIVLEMQRELRKRAKKGERSAATLTLHAFQKRVGWRRDRSDEAGSDSDDETVPFSKPSVGRRLFDFVSNVTKNPSVVALNSPKSLPNSDARAQRWGTLFVSCTDTESVATARQAIIGLITKSKRSYEMPDSYTDVLRAIVEMRQSHNEGTAAETRVKQAIVPIDSLVKLLLVTASTEAKCRSILQTLHDLGDVLWYEELGIDLFRNSVILDPLLLIDFVRQVINHNHHSEMLAHAELQSLRYWQDIEGRNLWLALKQVLEKFQLVHPSDGEMKWNSDLIVPAFWKSKTPASWLFGYEDVRLAADVGNDDPNKPKEQVRVHWQYQFTHEFPDSLFDHLVVATYSPYMGREAGPDWIMYADDGVFACRAMVARDGKTLQRVLQLEAVLAHGANDDATNELWEAFECLSEGIVKVLRRYPGLVVTSVALDTESKMKDLESLFRFPLKERSRKWMPRTESWERYKKLVRDVHESGGP